MARLRSARLLLFGRARNADLERLPPWPVGAAATIATGMSALELGSDRGGSILWPAHCCGISGLKTVWNLVLSRARSTADLAFALDVLAGPRNPLMSAETLVSPRHASLGGRRVAPLLDEPSAPVDATVAAAMRKAALMLEKAGAIVDEFARPAFSFENAWKVFAILVPVRSSAPACPIGPATNWPARNTIF